MINLTQINKVGNGNYNYVECPQCKRKLCCKPIGVKMTTIKIEGGKARPLSHILLQCYRCKSMYLVTIVED